MAAACQKALNQIEEKKYTARLKEDGMRSIIQYGIACYKKDWKSRCAKITRRAVFNCAALLTKRCGN